MQIEANCNAKQAKVSATPSEKHTTDLLRRVLRRDKEEGATSSGGRLREMRRVVGRSGTTYSARKVNGSRRGESTKSVRKVITDYAYAYSICTHGGGDGEMDEKLLYIYNKNL